MINSNATNKMQKSLQITTNPKNFLIKGLKLILFRTIKTKRDELIMKKVNLRLAASSQLILTMKLKKKFAKVSC